MEDKNSRRRQRRAEKRGSVEHQQELEQRRAAHNNVSDAEKATRNEKRKTQTKTLTKEETAQRNEKRRAAHGSVSNEEKAQRNEKRNAAYDSVSYEEKAQRNEKRNAAYDSVSNEEKAQRNEKRKAAYDSVIRRTNYKTAQQGMTEDERTQQKKKRQVDHRNKTDAMSEQEKESSRAKRRHVNKTEAETKQTRERKQKYNKSRKTMRQANLSFGEDCYDSDGQFVLTEEKLETILSEKDWDVGFQSDIRMATLLYHLNSGHYRFGEWKEYASKYANETVDIDAIEKEILDERLTDEELYNLMKRFYSAHSYTEGNLCTCGACGWRQMERKSNPEIKYERVSLSDDLLQPLLLTEDQRKEFDDMIQRGGVPVPTELGAETTIIHPWKVMSVVPTTSASTPVSQTGTGNTEHCYMHLHPETVEIDDSNGSMYTRLCPECTAHLRGRRKGKVPPMSVAAGVDFGSYRRAGLPELTLHEEIILAKIKVYFASVKITSNTGVKVDMNTRSAVKGNAILWRNESARIVSEILDKEILNDLFHVHMIDSSKRSDEMMKKMLQTSTLLARPWVLFQWLVVLQAVNPYYKDIANLDWEAMKEKIDALNKEVLNNATIIRNKNAVVWEQSLGSDVGKSHYIERSANDTADGNITTTDGNVPTAGSITTGKQPSSKFSTVPPQEEVSVNEPLPLRCSVLMDIPGTSCTDRNKETFEEKCSNAMSNFVLKNSSTTAPLETVTEEDLLDGIEDMDQEGVSIGNNSMENDERMAEDGADSEVNISGSVTNTGIGRDVLAEPRKDDDREQEGEEEEEEKEERNDGADEEEEQQQDVGEDIYDLHSISDFDLDNLFVEQKLAESQRETHPVNEISDGGEELLAMAFPSVFLLGKSYKKTAARLTKTERNHLFNQHTLLPARNRMLLAYIHNSQQRFQVNCGVSAHVASNPKSVAMIQDMLTDPKVRESFQKLKDAPKSDKTKALAKKLSRKYLPLLRFSGRDVSYGATECYGLKSKTFESSKRYSPAASFLTLSFNDSDNPRNVRASFHTVNNTSFPARFEENSIHGKDGVEFMEKLKEGSTLRSEGVLPMHTSDARARASISNPVTFVAESKDLIFDVLDILLGKPPEKFASKYEGGTARKNTRYFGRDKGVLGHCLAYIGVPEDHAKGTLHYHILFFGGLPPYLLQKCANIEELIPSLASVLDSMYKSELPSPVLVSKILTEVVDKPNSVFRLDKNKPEFPELCKAPLLTRHQPPMYCIPCDDDDDDDDDNNDGDNEAAEGAEKQHPFFNSVVEATNCQATLQMWHIHMKTCHKGLFGVSGCRLCMKAGMVDRTKPVELWLREKDDGKQKQGDVGKDNGDSEAAKEPDVVEESTHPVVHAVTEPLTAFDMEDEDNDKKGIAEKLSAQNPHLDFSKVAVDEFETDNVRYVRVSPPPKPTTPQTYGKEPGEMFKPKETAQKICIWESARPETTSLADSFRPEFSSNVASSSAQNILSNKKDLLQNLQNILSSVEGFEAESPIWVWLQNLPDAKLGEMFKLLSKNLKDANGNIATYNPTLAYLTGSHNNVQILGGQDQALAAVFYICPYIAKRKAPLEESMSILNHCFELAQKYPTSLEEEKDDPQRFAKLVLQKTLNRMNLTMELSDWQIAAAVIGLPSIICSDVFIHRKTSGLIGYRKYIAGAADPRKAREKLVAAANTWTHSRYGNSGAYYDAEEAADECGLFEWEQMEGNESGPLDKSSLDGDGDNDGLGGGVNGSNGGNGGGDGDGGNGYDGDDADIDRIDGYNEEETFDHESNDTVSDNRSEFQLSTDDSNVDEEFDSGGAANDDAVVEDSNVVQQTIVVEQKHGTSTTQQEQEPAPYIGKITVHKVTGEPDENGDVGDKQPILLPDAELYYHRGKDLRFLAPHEYYSLIEVRDIVKPKGKRKVRMGRYSFAPSFDLHGKREQVVVAKQPTTVLTDKWPKHPDDPENPADMDDPESDWSKAANKFASYVLTEYRAEVYNYGDPSTKVVYRYDYEALIQWVEKCMDSPCVRDKFLLSAANRRCTALNGSPFCLKQVAMAYRARNRTNWTVEQRQKYCRRLYLERLQEKEDRDLIDQSTFEEDNQNLSPAKNKNMRLQETYDKNLCRSLLRVTKVQSDTAQTVSDSEPDSTGEDDHPSSEVASANKTKLVEKPLDEDRYVPQGVRDNADLEETDHDDYQELVQLRLRQSKLTIEFDRGMEDRGTDDETNGESEQEADLDNAGTGSAAAAGVPSKKQAAVAKAREGLNGKQKEMFDTYMNYFENNFQTDLVPSLFLIHGMGGTGKTEGITRLEPLIKYYKKKILCMAFNNINALMFPNGKTTASLINVQHSQDFKDLTLEKKKELEKLLKDVKLIVIDEVGNQAPFHLAQLSHVCQLVLQNDKPFGGIPVVAIGDYVQLGPVKAGDPLPKAAMNVLLREVQAQTSAWKRKKQNQPSLLDAEAKDELQYQPDHPYSVGSRLMQGAEFLEMTKQMRSDDIDHNKIIGDMYRTKDVSVQSIINQYKPLRPSDFDEDAAGWVEAPIIVTSNRERLSLTHQKAVDFAKLHNTVVIRWLAKHRYWAQKPAPQYQEQAMMNDPCFFEYFVPGAQCYFNANVSKQLKLVNSQKARYHSLVMEDKESNDWLQTEIERANPGDVITLPFLQRQAMAPATVTVAIDAPRDDVELLDRYRLLFEECPTDNGARNAGDRAGQPLPPAKFLVPIGAQQGRDFVRCTVRSGNGYRASRVDVRPQFPLEPAFAITVHKSQGQTLDKVILALSCRPSGAMMQFTYNGLYVALSRVRKSTNIRILYIGDSAHEKLTSLSYLSDLKPDPYQISFLHGFRNGPIVEGTNRRRWSPQHALQKLKELDKQQKR